jgi:hypothetical protein
MVQITDAQKEALPAAEMNRLAGSGRPERLASSGCRKLPAADKFLLMTGPLRSWTDSSPTAARILHAEQQLLGDGVVWATAVSTSQILGLHCLWRLLRNRLRKFAS